jgi:hypothetical protein
MDNELIAGGTVPSCSETVVHENRCCPILVTTLQRNGNLHGENKPLRGIRVGSSDNAGATPELGAIGRTIGSVTGLGSGGCHGVVWGVGICMASIESGVLHGVCEARRSNRFILEKLFFSEDSLKTVLGAGATGSSCFIGVL